MSLNHLLSDTLARIKNAQMARHDFVIVRSSKFILMVLEVLKSEGFIQDFEAFEQRKGVHLVKVDLMYFRDKPVITKVRMMSKPGCRMFRKSSKLPKSYNGLGVTVVSTSKGVMAGHSASAEGVGGEVLFEIF